MNTKTVVKGVVIAGVAVAAAMLIGDAFGGVAELVGSLFDGGDIPDIPTGGDSLDALTGTTECGIPAFDPTMTEGDLHQLNTQLDRQQAMLDVQTDIENHKLARDYRSMEISARSNFMADTGLSFDHVIHPERLPLPVRDKWDACRKTLEACASGLDSLGMAN